MRHSVTVLVNSLIPISIDNLPAISVRPIDIYEFASAIVVIADINGHVSWKSNDISWIETIVIVVLAACTTLSEAVCLFPIAT